jgi:putative PIN family toxin of toxin-antitoxin system
MLPLRLVLDTNIVVSAALHPDGLPRTTFLLAITKPAHLYVTQPILGEYASVLRRPALKVRKGDRLRLLALIRNHSHLIRPTRRLAVASDPDDDMFLECADQARADYLITGNRRHFPAFWKGTKIISSREFIALVAPHLLH